MRNRCAGYAACCLALIALALVPVRGDVDAAPAGRPGIPQSTAPHPGRGEVAFRFAPLAARVALGRDILFSGLFVVDDEDLLSRLRRAPLVVRWRIVKRGTAVAVLQGSVVVRGRHTPLRARTRPAEVGEYALVLMPIDPPEGLTVRVDHPGRGRIEVVAPSSLR